MNCNLRPWTIVTFVGLIFVVKFGVRSQSVQFSLQEELPAQVVGKIPFPIGQTYRLSTTSELFELNEVTGDLRSLRPIDRDTLDSDVIRLLAIATSDSLAPIDIKVDIIDINDNDPAFPPPAQIDLSIHESTEIGAQYFLPTATDADAPSNGVTTNYDITKGDDAIFNLSVDSSLGDATLLYITTKQMFNREAKDSYTLNISATDNGTPPRKGYLLVNVTILDNNDNKPVFDQNEYDVMIYENATVGSIILRVNASDEDEGNNGLVRYRLAEQANNIRAMFAIDPESGIITLLQPLDRETSFSHRLALEAYDRGDPGLTGRAFATITVNDVNDNDPVINIRFRPSTASIVSVDDGATPGSLVALIIATDGDAAQDLNVSIFEGNEQHHFEFVFTPGLNIGRLMANGPINRFIIPRYNLTFIARDNDFLTPRLSYKSIAVVVNSANNHDPVFNLALYKAQLSELSPNGSYVIDLFAQDLDVGITGRLIYSIEDGNDLGWFQITSSTGLITTKATRLRCEQIKNENKTITLLVAAKDESSSPRSASTLVQISIIDENDNAPVFSETTHNADVPEATSPIQITTVLARDADSGEGGKIRYSLHSASSSSGRTDIVNLFQVDSANGILSVMAPLKRSDAARYDLYVAASDNGNPPLTSTAAIQVTVTERNDTAPIFYPRNYYVTLSPGTYENYEITRVEATVLGSSSDSIRYSVVSGVGGVTVNSVSGAVTISSTLASSNLFMSHVNAVYTGGLAAERVAAIYILVDDEDKSVRFENPNSEILTLENTSPSTQIGDVTATSDVTGSNIRYSIVEGDPTGSFKVSNLSGVLSLSDTGQLDYEKQQQHNLTVAALLISADGSLSSFALSSLLVKVKDVNDNPPLFINREIKNATSVSGSITSFSDKVYLDLARNRDTFNYIVYNASAKDFDSAENGEVKYSLQDPLKLFTIDNDGLIRVKSRINLIEIELVYDVIVFACDVGSPQMCAQLHLSVFIRPWIGSYFISPQIPSTLQVVLNENTSVNRRFIDLSHLSPTPLADPVVITSKGDIMRVVKYEIINGNVNDLFGIFPDGNMYLKRADLDRELIEDYFLAVTITFKNEQESYIQTVIVAIHITDANDNAPVFRSIPYTFSIVENLPLDSVVGHVYADDQDIGIRSIVAYSININDNASDTPPPPFVVDLLSGTVKTTSKIDKEIMTKVWNATWIKNDTFLIPAAVADNIGASIQTTLTGKTTVEILIQDVNEFPPEFSRLSYMTDIPEDSKPGSFVIQVAANDRDDNNNFRFQIQTNREDFPFVINSDTGIVTIAWDAVLDREAVDSYTFQVLVEDSGLPISMSAVTSVQIRLIDVNDESPSFDLPSLNFKIAESSQLHQEVARVQAVDLDEFGANSIVWYMFGPETNSEAKRVFKIDESSGIITLVDMLDRESVDTFELIVIATDSGINVQNTATATLRIDVEDTNDNFPIFAALPVLRITEGNYLVPVPIGTVSANDLDTGKNGQVTYEVIGRTPYQPEVNVIIEKESGRLSISGLVDREAYLPTSKLSIAVKATDNSANSSERLWTWTYVNITIEDVNDNKPIFTSPDSIFLPTRSASDINYEIGSIVAYDPDEGKNGSVNFTPFGAGSTSVPFEVEPATGILRLNTFLPDRVVHTIRVAAFDQGVPSQFSMMTLNIIMGEESLQNGPSFTRTSFRGSVEENVEPGTPILTISARGSQIGYYITGVSATDVTNGPIRILPFAIDSSTGQITNRAKLDRDRGVTSYTIDVVAVNMNSTRTTPRMTSTKVIIDVTDVNDRPPLFKDPLIEVFISESKRVGYVITNRTASDEDETSTISYSLEASDGSDDFIISSTTGSLQISPRGLDREQVAMYNLRITASDGVHKSSYNLVIHVTDANDHVPTFSSPHYVMSVSEGYSTPPSDGRYIGSVQAVDMDAGLYSMLTYSFVNGSDQGRFVLDSYSGIIHLNPSYREVFDRERRDLYLFIIRATDGGGLFSDVVVYLNVADVNDNVPVFEDHVNDVELREDVDVGTYVARVQASDADLDFNGIVEYGIVAGDAKQQFKVAIDTGIITVGKTLDREIQSTYILTVVATDLAPLSSRLSSFTNLTIAIIDVNDNPPDLIMPSLWYVPENSSPGTEILCIGAFDRDNLGDKSGFTYTLESQTPDDSAFRLDPATGILYVGATHLDREGTNRYNLTVSVTDHGSTPLSTSRILEIVITDTNDNFPVFNMTPSYVVDIPENSRTGSVIAKVQAEDADEGINAFVQYRLLSQAPTPNNIAIDSNSGEIYLTSQLDREIDARHELLVQAYDAGLPSQTTNVTVVINVIDVNDCEPVISPLSSIVHVSENVIAPLQITQFEVFDNDTGVGGRVDFRGAMVTRALKDGLDLSQTYDDLATLFTLSSTGQLSLARSLDREKVDTFNVVITAVDRGTPSLSGSSTVLVVVDNVNGYAPVFRLKRYIALIPENATVGTTVVTVTAHDNDDGEMEKVRYSLISTGDNLPFVVDPTTGMIVVSQSLDYEETIQYQFTAIATDTPDGDGVQRSSPTTVTIQISDVNDNTPRFTQISYEFLPTSSGEVCGVVYADDRDTGVNAKVTYSLLWEDSSLPFKINSSTGVITRRGVLSSPSYSFQVKAEDNSRNAITNVTVRVNNEAHPSFTNKPSTALTVVENSTPDSVGLFLFQAVTSRTGSSVIRYLISGGNINNSFSINAETGELTRVKLLDREMIVTFNLWIEAKDSETPSLSAYSNIIINVQDSNDNAPIFSKYIYTGSIQEDTISSSIVAVSANDPDTNDGGMIQYLFDFAESEDADKFELDSTGNIRNRVRLNREEKESYFLTVLARDRAAPSLTSSASVLVHVEDINDNFPSFTRLYSVTVKEDAIIGGFVTQITSSDPDTEDNSQNLYSLRESANNSFAIDPVSGVLTVNKQLDREKRSSYEIEVEASDGSFSTHTSVAVTITDVNDNAPRFNMDGYDVTVISGIPEDSFVIKLSSIDADEGLNGQVWYAIESSTDYCSINHTSGEILTTRKLKCTYLTDCPTRYNLVVSATDGGSPQSMTSSTNISVTVVAPNLYPPVFRNEKFPVAVLQDSPVGTIVFNLTADDEDLTQNSVTFNLTGGSHALHFAVDHMTGVVTTSKLLSPFPITSKLAFIVRATDNGLPPKFSELTITLEVAGMNVHTPSFVRHSDTAIPISEDVPVGREVIMVEATDVDLGINGKIQYHLHSDDMDKPFRVNETTGTLYTTSRLDYELVSSYLVKIIASDLAVSPMTSEIVVEIPIIDVNDNPPQFNSSQFVTYIPENLPPQTIITRLQATDKDSGENGIITYGVIPQREILIRALTGDLSAASNTHLDYETTNKYQLKVIATDQAKTSFEDSSNLTLYITDVNEYAPAFQGSTVNFFTSVSSLPGNVVAQLNVTDRDSGSRGDILFSLAGWSEGLGFSVDQLTGALQVAEDAILMLGDKVDLTIIAKNPGSADVNLSTLVKITVSVVTDECMGKPCKNGATCLDGPDKFTCLCKPGYTGGLCEADIDDCLINPCINGGTCNDLVADFNCTCPVGYDGKTCNNDIDYCIGDPCLNGGTCRDGLITYTCQCLFGATGLSCEINSLGFQSLSYLVLPTLDYNSNRITFEFATVSSSALLLYNPGESSTFAFVALEITQGKVRLSYNFGMIPRNNTFRISAAKNVNDGLWHRVAVDIGRSEASVNVDDCASLTSECSAFQSHSGLPENALSLLAAQSMFLGGIKSTSVILEHPNQVSSFDFVGCIRNFTINGVVTGNMSSPEIMESSSVTNGCLRNLNVSNGNACKTEQGTPVCGIGATCVDQWSSSLCQCPANLSGKKCQNDRVGSTFNGLSYLIYAFSMEYVQENTILSSGALYSTQNRRKKRQVQPPAESSISLRFRTRQLDGLLFLARSSGAVANYLQVKNAALLSTYQTSSGPMEHSLLNNASDGLWHDVSIQLSPSGLNTLIEITVDGLMKVAETYTGGITDFADPSQVETIYIGGTDTSVLPSAVTLNGCIFSFSINGESQPLADDGGSTLLVIKPGGATSSGSVSLGCSGEDECALNPCPGDTYCRDIWNARECIPLGFCATKPCLQNGTCIPEFDGSYNCNCLALYSGQNCETYIPCLTINCGANQVCAQAGDLPAGTTCVCALGYFTSDGGCINILAGGIAWWIYLISIIGALVLIAILVYILRRKCNNTTKQKSTTPTQNNRYQEKKTPVKNESGNGQIGRGNESYEFDKINNSTSEYGSLPRPDLLPEDVVIVDEETIVSREMTTSGVTSPRSIEMSSINDISPPSGDAVSPDAKEEETSLNLSNSLRSSANLPPYDVLMRERMEHKSPYSSKSSNPPTIVPSSACLSGKDSLTETDTKKQTKFPFDIPVIHQSSYLASPDPSVTSRSASSVFPPSSIDLKSHSAYHSRSTINMKDSMSGSHSSRNTDSMSSRRTMNLLALKPPYVPSGKTSPYLPRGSTSPFFPSDKSSSHYSNGRTSAPKSITSLSYRSESHPSQRNYASSLHGHEQRHTPSSGYNKKISGSLASSSTTSSVSNEPPGTGSPENVTTIEDMVQHLNGLVGLTNEEIELLNENPKISYPSSFSSGSNSNSDPPSTNIDKPRFKFNSMPHNPHFDSRPSSLPGRRINRVSVGSRSRTPMLLPPTSPYKQTTGEYRLQYPGIPPDLRPSEFLQPPPDTSSDEEDFYPSEKFSELCDTQNKVHSKHENTSITKNTEDEESLSKSSLDFLMPYGKHNERLAAIFEDLKVLPSSSDVEDLESEGYSESSLSYKDPTSQSKTLPARAKTPTSRKTSQSSVEYSNQLRSGSLGPTSRASMSPSSASSSRPQSVNRKRQEHYV